MTARAEMYVYKDADSGKTVFTTLGMRRGGRLVALEQVLRLANGKLVRVGGRQLA